ncbi:TolC family protein [Arundinibacter roseus]|uniref:TolC family protein n=1 Tax=Arundinibacter roseus TaxID=2070510 RepID=A0A4R4KIX7_9BACT|nr:TolC family protein [Arundinibacter roseus]TDB66792.1 TolC family protein [Arundinibacter roseus]
MRTKIILTAFVLLRGLAVGAQSIDSTTIQSLEELWRIALQKNGNQQVYTLQRQKAEADYKTARSFLYPQAGASFNGLDFLELATTPVPGELVGQPGTTLDLQFGKKYQYNAGLTMTKGLFDWQKKFQAQAAKENIALTGAQQGAFEQSLKTQLAQYYYSWQVANASTDIFSKDLALADSILKLANQKFSQGLIPITPVNKAQIDYNNVLQNIYQSEELKQLALSNIKKLTGIELENDLVLRQETDLVRLYTNVPELGIDRNLLVYPHSIASADHQSKAARAAFYPSLSLMSYTGSQQFRSDFGLSLQSSSWSGYRYLGLNLNVPLFTGFATKNKLQSATIQKQIVEVQFKDAQKQSAINDNALKTSFSNYLSMTNNSKKTFELFGENLELARQQYAEGLISVDSYLKSFEDYLSAENMYLNSLSNLLMVQASVNARK